MPKIKSGKEIATILDEILSATKKEWGAKTKKTSARGNYFSVDSELFFALFVVCMNEYRENMSSL